MSPGAVSSAGRAPALHAGGRGFEPLTAHSATMRHRTNWAPGDRASFLARVMDLSWMGLGEAVVRPSRAGLHNFVLARLAEALDDCAALPCTSLTPKEATYVEQAPPREGKRLPATCARTRPSIRSRGRDGSLLAEQLADRRHTPGGLRPTGFANPGRGTVGRRPALGLIECSFGSPQQRIRIFPGVQLGDTG